MAKTAPLKKKGATSVRSREARRASSPSIDTDKSLKNLKPPVESQSHRPSVLAIHQGAGVSKRLNRNGRKSVLSAKAKRRQEKGMDRAEAFLDKREIKIHKSKGKARIVQNRGKTWEDQNKKVKAQDKLDGRRESVDELSADEISVAADDVAQDDMILGDAVGPISVTVPIQAIVDDDEEIL